MPFVKHIGITELFG